MKHFFIACLLLVCASACRNNTAPDMNAARPAVDSGDSAVLASVNGSPISMRDLDNEMDGLVSQYQNRVSEEQLVQLRETVRSQALDNLISKQLLLQEADRKNLQPAQDDIAAEIDAIISQFPSREAFQQQLSVMGISQEDLSQDVTNFLKINAVLQEQLAAIPAGTDREIATFYEENRDTFALPEQVRARHILLAFSEEDTPETKAFKRGEAEQLRSRILQGGDFNALAAEHSDCPSKSRGGDLGFFERGAMVAAFEDTAFSLSPGEVSSVVETPFGYHLIKVSERKAARTLSLEEATPQITENLQGAKESQEVSKFLQGLREAATVEYMQPAQ
jgi:peptidyl-prolyl cis-trans isomerase C